MFFSSNQQQRQGNPFEQVLGSYPVGAGGDLGQLAFADQRQQPQDQQMQDQGGQGWRWQQAEAAAGMAADDAAAPALAAAAALADEGASDRRTHREQHQYLAAGAPKYGGSVQQPGGAAVADSYMSAAPNRPAAAAYSSIAAGAVSADGTSVAESASFRCNSSAETAAAHPKRSATYLTKARSAMFQQAGCSKPGCVAQGAGLLAGSPNAAQFSSPKRRFGDMIGDIGTPPPLAPQAAAAVNGAVGGLGAALPGAMAVPAAQAVAHAKPPRHLSGRLVRLTDVHSSVLEECDYIELGSC